MATGHAADRLQSALQQAIAVDRLICILRAGRVEAARRRKHRRDESLVQSKEPEYRVLRRADDRRRLVHLPASPVPSRLDARTPARRSTVSVAVSSSPNDADPALGRATKTRSHPGASRSSRCLTISRIRRLNRLRATAEPYRLPTDMPTRRGARSELERASAFGRAYTTSEGLANERPRWRTIWKSALAVRRCRRCTGARFRGRP